MRKQKELLRAVHWNALVILDACRADSWARHDPGAETVRSMAPITFRWVPQLHALYPEERVLYVTANPVVDRELRKRKANNFRLISVWRDGWGRYGPLRLPTVHPATVNDVVRLYVEAHGRPRRMVVHYIQPHMPYVGAPSLPYADWGGCANSACARELHRLKHPKRAVAEGLTTREAVRAAYEANVDLVAEWAKGLIAELRGTVVLTSDHGELLGEDGRYGHAKGDHPVLRRVPWRVFQRTPFEPSPILVVKI